ncbi:MAG: EAL domain-containing protein [Pseudomonadota bacterium]
MALPAARIFRTGITLRLGLGFAVVGLLVATANLVAQRGAAIVSEAWRSADAPAPQASVVTPLPLRAPTASTAILVKKPPSADPLIVALAGFETASLARIASGAEGASRELDMSRAQLRSAAQKLDAQLSGFARPRDRKAIAASVDTVIRRSASAISAVEARRAESERYQERLATLQARIETEMDQAFKMFGRVIARQYLVRLQTDIGALRNLGAVLGTTDYSAADLQKIAAAEDTLAGLLQEVGAKLAKSKGQEWLDAMRSDLDAAITLRTNIAFMDASRTESVASLRSSVMGVGLRVDDWHASRVTAAEAPASIASVPQPVAVTAPVASLNPRSVRNVQVAAAEAQTRQLQHLILLLTVSLLLVSLVICVGTVRSIVKPVRNMLKATLRVASGERSVVVERGGLRELDTLAAAFNTMAAEVDAARQMDERHKHELEERVEERTRQLKFQAFHDPLTQLPNRRLLFQRLTTAIEDARKNQRIVAVYFLDLDNFKHINDGTGHEFGDALLVACGARLKQTVHEVGFVGRFGGDEFAVIAINLADSAAVQALGESLVKAFQQPLQVEQRELMVGVTVGAALFPDHHDTPEALLRAADSALYRAKSQGRNCFLLYTPELQAAAAIRFSTEQQLRRALDTNELTLLYQPELDCRVMRAGMVEALLRWRRSDGELATPDTFLAVAEDSGMIGEISDWVLQRALAEVAGWRAGAWPDARVAINVSSRQFLDQRFALRVRHLLDHYHVPADAVEIELTENVLQTGPQTIAALHRLREEGVSIALDDFGTGYSSLASLDRLPITRVKLDRSLIAEIDTKARSSAIVSATIQLCRDLTLEVTAEGIERQAQFAALMRHQPLMMQGYLIARPVAAAEVPALVDRLPEIGEHLLLDSTGLAESMAVVSLFPSARQRSK